MVTRVSLLLLTIFFLSSCAMLEQKQQDYGVAIRGNWLILYPDHDLLDAKQRKIYSAVQDSIVGLFGLKTISFNGDGSFVQTDSILQTPGKWHFNEESKSLFIRNAGKGLDFFKSELVGIRKDTMRIIEEINVQGEKLKITWFLKRIVDKKNEKLYDKRTNWWRQHEASASTGRLREKVKAMLDYYAVYYEMISKESSYFVQARVFLPVSYYQHSMALKPFNETGRFSQLFYNEEQAREGHAILSSAMDKVSDQRFPSGKDFVIEYAMYLKRLAEAIEK